MDDLMQGKEPGFRRDWVVLAVHPETEVMSRIGPFLPSLGKPGKDFDRHDEEQQNQDM